MFLLVHLLLPLIGLSLLCFGTMSQVAVAQVETAHVSVRTADGGTLSAELMAIDGQLVELKTDQTDQTDQKSQFINFDSIESITFDNQRSTQNASAGTFQCQLADGSLINGASISISGSEVQIELAAGGRIELAKSSLRYLLLFNSTTNPKTRQQWNEFLTTFSSTSDAIIASKNESLQAIEGVVGDVTEAGFQFAMGERAVTVRAEKLTGVCFYRADREFPEPVCEIRLVNGSGIAVQQAVYVEEVLNCVTCTGDQISLPIDQVTQLNFAAGRTIYLSDLVPTTNAWLPLVASPANLDALVKLNSAIADQAFSGQPLTLRNTPADGLGLAVTTQTYAKGFAIAGGGRLAFNLNGQFKRLTALVGFDPETEGLEGNVRLEFRVDDKKVINEVLQNREVTRPLPVDIDVEGVQRLVIRVDYHDRRSVGDRIHIVEARVSR